MANGISFWAAVEARNYLAVGSVVVATLLTMAYFQRLFVSIFRESHADSSAVVIEMPAALRVSAGAISAAIIFLGLCSDPIIKFFRDAAVSMGL